MLSVVSTHTLLLVRHGQSRWNLENLFTGWYDSDLTDKGRAEATAAGELLAAEGELPDVVHTSLQVRAIRTADLALDACDRLWVPVRRSWRLNERHYGDLQGKDKKELAQRFGADQVHVWRRSYDTPPPALELDDPRHPRHDPRYADLPLDVLPASECLKDVVERMLPWFFDAVCADLAAGKKVLVAAHGNSLRALVKHLQGISDDDIPELNIPTGAPLRYVVGDDLRPVEDLPVEQRYLGDPEAVAAAAAAVAEQAG